MAASGSFPTTLALQHLEEISEAGQPGELTVHFLFSVICKKKLHEISSSAFPRDPCKSYRDVFIYHYPGVSCFEPDLFLAHTPPWFHRIERPGLNSLSPLPLPARPTGRAQASGHPQAGDVTKPLSSHPHFGLCIILTHFSLGNIL